MSTQRFAVEFNRRTVGIAVRAAGGFRFYASDSRFESIDGQLFPRARAIERELTKMAPKDRAPVKNRRCSLSRRNNTILRSTM